ncbi:DUF2812 domain-containing protein [Enterococcus saccharolyticus]|uniref:DUF2812 domain-containing protein n=1 Tax=Enterococcus TaxID=1350 RepID=UPI001E50B94A|nr:DUF2812 domain-containing protein [Enterococcus saccharolyticus]MCD5002499.1 DUF2812 domain-containing protein [Enterococcus saccharolyticus]
MKKYLFSLGIHFYAEKECVRLEEQARKGWQFIKMNNFGILSFQKSSPQEKQFAIDFYTGDKSQAEIDEYLEMYRVSGWQYVTNYKKKYFYFMANKSTPKIFSDKVSYHERLQAEEQWYFKRSFSVSGIGVLLWVLIFWLYQQNGLRHLISIVTSLAVATTLYPLLYRITAKLMHLRYKHRPDYYNNPEAFAKKQRIWRDSLLHICVGAFIGGVIGFIFGYFT